MVRRLSSFAINQELVLEILLLFFFGIITLWPLSRLGLEILFSRVPPASLIRETLLEDPSAIRALRNTVDAAIWSSLLAVLIGGGAALLISLSDMRGKGIATFLVLIPMLMPSQITSLAWKELVGFFSDPGVQNPLYSRQGVVLVLGVEHSTAVFLAVRSSLRSLSWDLVEAARVLGAKPYRIIRTVILPLIFPGILAGFSLSFVAAIGNFGVPALLGIPGRFPVLTTLIYRKLNGFGTSVLSETAVLSLVLIVLACAGLALRAAASRSFSVKGTKEGTEGTLLSLGRNRLLVEAGIWSLFAVVSILPFLSLVRVSLVPAVGVPLTLDTATLKHFRFVLLEQSAVVRSFGVSFRLALTSACLTTLIAIFLAYLSETQKRFIARILDIVADAPYAIPGIAVSISMILAFLPPIPLIGSLYSTFWILLIAYISRFMALTLRAVVAGLEQFDPKLEESAQVLGAGLWYRIFTVILPSVAPSAAAGALLVFIAALNELTVSSLLWSTGNETIGVMIYALHYEGNSPAAAALSLISVSTVFFAAGLTSWLGRSLPRGVLPWQA